MTDCGHTRHHVLIGQRWGRLGLGCFGKTEVAWEPCSEQDAPAPPPSVAQDAPDGAPGGTGRAEAQGGSERQQEFIGPAHPNYQGPKDSCEVCGQPAEMWDGIVGAHLCGRAECLEIVYVVAEEASQPKAAHDDGRVCRCVSVHRPAPLELERHHVWPLGMGGPEEDWNVEWVCPTAHTNAHELLRAMVRQDRAIPLEEFSREYAQPVSRWAHHLAVVGYQRWKNHVSGGPAQAARLRGIYGWEGA